tara:strand:+ start:723 stop:926 length:204 start_codon:yes stop_codon:yes gene_type:complete
MKLNKLKIAKRKATELLQYIEKNNIEGLQSENGIDLFSSLHFDIIETLSDQINELDKEGTRIITYSN